MNNNDPKSSQSNSITFENDQTLLDLIAQVEKNTKVRFYFVKEWLEPFKVKASMSGQTLEAILNAVLSKSEISIIFLHEYAVIFFKDPQGALERDALVTSAQKKKIKVDEISLGSSQSFEPGKFVTLRGKVKDKDEQTPIVGATIFVNGVNISAQSDANGNYELTLLNGEYVLNVRYLNFDERLLVVKAYQNGEVDIDLMEAPTTLDEVLITSESIVDRRVGQTSLKISDVVRSPTFLGEKDILKTLQIQAGVTTVSEASSGYNVRGGSVDQNLILYDNIPIFNASHALGFFSAFNAEAIKETNFYKGGIPAEYGGRVSSVLSIASREGDYQNWHGTAGIGFISGNFSLGGPIEKDKSSVFVSVRSTYSDWILNFLETKYGNVAKSSVAFSDGSLKYTLKTGNGGKLTVSSYFSRDRFQLATDSINYWANKAIGIRYGNSFTNGHYYSVELNLGHYGYQVRENDPPTAFKLSYGILYPSFKLDINKEGRHKLSYGFHSTFYDFSPGNLEPTSENSNSRNIKMRHERSTESALYISDSFFWKEKFQIEVGTRLSMYNRLGSGWRYNYKADGPIESRNLVDSTYYHSGEVMKTFQGFEPRLSVKYTVSPNRSVKLGYNRMFQYIHLVTNTAAVTPVDIWQSSNAYFKPQLVDQISLGYFGNSANQKWHGYAEAFYKHNKNTLDFKDGANLILNTRLETALVSGVGKSYGLELSFGKTKGKFEVDVNYTFSRSFRKTDGQFESEKINSGKWYRSNFDQPHIFNFSWRYALSRKIFFTGMFTFRTGRPISIPLSGYNVDRSVVIDFSDRNNYRLANYHRMDVAFVTEGSNKKNRRIQGTWSLSIYNLYGRRNPYSAYFAYNIGTIKSYQLSLIGVPVPSLTYGIKF